MTETRIRWEETKHGGWTGHVGTVDGFVFQVWKPAPLGEKPYRLESGLPGGFGRIADGADPEVLKAEAERWLEEFVSSLGAVFPEDAYEFEEDDEPLEVRFGAGCRVRYQYPEAGYPGEAEAAAEVLVPGEVYTIGWADIGQARTDLILTGVEGAFNSVHFEPVDDPDPAPGAAGQQED